MADRSAVTARCAGRLVAVLLTSTALCGLGGGAAAQLAPNARPTGGQVVAGSATIATAPTTTTIDQTTQRAAINWQSFNVGANQTVVFQQPSASAMTLNTVVGPNPSAIAGRITANGGIVITNQSGVVFHAGAQVDATSLVVSAPGVTTQNFMAGHLVFDQAAKPGAAVVNQGTLTIKQAGLAALVAPQVRNSGVINAKLGHVVLAGAAATTLDLYGDGLVSIDITKQVATAPGGQAALVTNTGLINAAGGTVQLSAAAADGVVTTLVNAGGRISAASLGQRTGSIAISGTGGALLVEGTLRATGGQPGTRGGAIEVAGSGSVTVGPRARITASGRAGGGTIALGTTLARARGGAGVTPKVVAASVSVTAGARVSADGGTTGSGGRVTLLSTGQTTLAGTITARGGSVGGNGGTVEVSSQGQVALTGSVDVSAPHGTLGSILLDPGALDIVSGEGSADGTVTGSGGTLLGNQPDTTSTSTVSNTALQALTGNITLQATQQVTVSAPITLTVAGQSLTIQSGGDLGVNAAIATNGNITLAANAAVAGAPTPTGDGVLTIGRAGVPDTNFGPISAPVTTTGGSITLSGASVVVTSAVTASGAISATATNGVTIAGAFAYGSGGSLAAGGNIAVAAGAGSASLAGPVTSTGGGVSVSGIAVQVQAAVTAQQGISLNATGQPDSDGASGVSTSGGGVLSAGGDVAITSQDYIAISPAVSSSAGSVSMTAATSITVADPVTAGPGQAISIAAPTVAIDAVLTVPGNSAAPQAGGPVNVLLQADALSLAQSTTPLIVAPGGIVAITPYTAGTSLAVDDSLQSSGLVLTTAGLGLIATGSSGSLYLGGVGPTATAVAGNLTIASPLDVTDIAGTLGVFARYTVTEPGSSVTAGTLLGTAGTLAFGDANAVSTLGPFTTVTGFTLNATLPLTVVGPVTGTAAQIALSAPNLTLAGLVAAPTVTLNASGAITQRAGVVTANTLSGSAATATLSALNNILSLGTFTTSNGFQLNNGIGLVVAGPVTDGNFVAVTSSGGLAVTGAVSAPAVMLVAAGPISLSSLADPNSAVVLASPAGSITGDLQVGSLQVQGSAGSATLAGSVGGVTGGPAAAVAQIAPAVNPNYRLNGCEIAVANCGATSTPPPTPTPPTELSVPVTSGPSSVLPVLVTPTEAIATAPPTSTLLLPAPAIDDLAQVLGLPLLRPGTTPALLDFAYPVTLPGEANPEIVLPNVSGRDY